MKFLVWNHDAKGYLTDRFEHTRYHEDPQYARHFRTMAAAEAACCQGEYVHNAYLAVGCYLCHKAFGTLKRRWEEQS